MTSLFVEVLIRPTIPESFLLRANELMEYAISQCKKFGSPTTGSGHFDTRSDALARRVYWSLVLST